MIDHSGGSIMERFRSALHEQYGDGQAGAALFGFRAGGDAR